MSSWDDAGNVNGFVTARYVRVLAGSCPLYGWMVWTRRRSSLRSTAATARDAGPHVAVRHPGETVTASA
jgi:hypothetical protein